MRKRSALFLILSVFLFSFGCAGKRYAHFVGQMERGHLVKPDTTVIYLQLADKKGAPASKGSVTIASKTAPLTLTPDEHGLVEFPIRSDLRRENPRVLIDGVGRIHGLVRYADFLKQCDDRAASMVQGLRIRIIDNRTATPFQGYRFTVFTKPSPLEFISDAEGVITLPVSDALLAENPPFVPDWTKNASIVPEWRYSQFLSRFAPVVTPGAEDFNLPVHCYSSRTGKPAANVRIRILASAGPIELPADSRGNLRFPVSQRLFSEDPAVVGYIPQVVALSTGLSAGFRAGSFGLTALRPARERAGEVFVETRGKQEIAADSLSVWYPPECADYAQRVLSTLEKQREFVRAFTGLEPLKWGVILLPELLSDSTYLVRQRDRDRCAWVYSVDELKSGFFAEINAHEWVDATISFQRNLRCRSLFISEGLAEYARFLNKGKRWPPAKGLLTLRDDGVKYVNLIDQFTRRTSPRHLERACYDVSFAFWYTLCKKHGDTLPSMFLTRLRDAGKYRTDTAIKILEDLTGDTNVRARLEKADVSEAIDLINSLQPQPAS